MVALLDVLVAAQRGRAGRFAEAHRGFEWAMALDGFPGRRGRGSLEMNVHAVIQAKAEILKRLRQQPGDFWIQGTFSRQVVRRCALLFIALDREVHGPDGEHQLRRVVHVADRPERGRHICRLRAWSRFEDGT